MKPYGLGEIEDATYNINQTELGQGLSGLVVRRISNFYSQYDGTDGKLANAITGLQKFHTDLRPQIDNIFHQTASSSNQLKEMSFDLSVPSLAEKKFTRHSFNNETNCSGINGTYHRIPNTTMSYCKKKRPIMVNNSYTNGLANDLTSQFAEFSDAHLRDIAKGKTDLINDPTGKAKLKEHFSINNIKKNGLITIIILFIMFFILRIILD